MKKVKVFEVISKKGKVTYVAALSKRDCKEFVEKFKSDLPLSLDMSGYYRIIKSEDCISNIVYTDDMKDTIDYVEVGSLFLDCFITDDAREVLES